MRRILAGAGLQEEDLQNTPDLPYDEDERRAWIAEGRPASALAQNCSGKHAAMLATCVVNGWDLATYRDPAHPLQQADGARRWSSWPASRWPPPGSTAAAPPSWRSR